VLIQGASAWAAGNDPGQTNSSKWHIKDIYKYLGATGDELSPEEAGKYCRFIIDCQDPNAGNFTDAYGEFVYSVKAYYTLKRFGYEPKYPLSVCEPPYRNFTSEEVREQMSVEGFREWLDYVYKNWDAYGAGSLRGHFIHPHVMNLEKAGKTIEDSPYIPVFKQWLLDNQGQNGFWNRPDDPEYNGWNGVMKMDSALKVAQIKLPRQDRMIRTVLKYQNPKDGNFTAAGGCTNHNALHTLRQWSKRNDMLMWEDIFRAMEFFTECLERRWDPVSSYFRPVPGFDQPPQFRATELAGMATGNVIEYCRILLNPENRTRLDKQQTRKGQDRITHDRIRSLLVRAAGIDALARDKVKEHLKAEHDRKYEQKSGQQR
jgi:hypothetical protein